jgi:prevent-host-death family protein
MTNGSLEAMTRKAHKGSASRAGDADTLAISEFKTRCLEILEGLRTTGHELVVTKHGIPIARVVPIRVERRPLRGMLKGELEILDDIVQVDLSRDWEANR